MYCQLSFSERESGKWPLGLSDFYHNYLISNDCFHHSGKISFAAPNYTNIQWTEDRQGFQIQYLTLDT